MTVRSKLPIKETDCLKLLVGHQRLEPPTATIKRLKELYGDWPECAPVDLTVVVVARLKVRRHIYVFHGDYCEHLTSDEVLLDPFQTLHQQGSSIANFHLTIDNPGVSEAHYFSGPMPAMMEPPNTLRDREACEEM
eukprot:4962984-Amphidinium_carterae.1